MWVVDFPVAVPCAEGFRYGSRLVALQNGSLQLTGSLYDAQFLALNDLVANTPRDDAGVIPVAQYHGVDILTIA